jgi:alpha,alpha-trehalose phosphorylase
MTSQDPAPSAERTEAKRHIEAVLFDLDGVVTRTAGLHAAAWKETFDDFRREWMLRGGPAFPPFDAETDYLAYVDGRPRREGVRAFLAARGLQLVEGSPTDGPEVLSVHGVGARKDASFLAQLRRSGVSVFASTVTLVRALRAAGLKTAVVTSSRNGREVLVIAGLETLFDARVDGIDAAVLGLQGKPRPDPFLRAAALLGVSPGRAVVIEDATSGVEAAQRGGFGLVVGVDRGGNREALAAHGADVVVGDLQELDLQTMERLLAAKREEVLSWAVEQEGFDAAREHGMESLFTVGNGYLGVRGALDTPLPGSQGDLFVAGVYDRKSAHRPYSELEFMAADRGDQQHTELVSLPFPFRVHLRVDGLALDPTVPQCRAHRRTLNLREGVLLGHADYDTDVDRRVAVRTQRWASLADLHLVFQEVSVRLLNHSGTVTLDLSIDDPELTAKHPHLSPVATTGGERPWEVKRYRTKASGVEVCMASRAFLEGEAHSAPRWEVPASIGRALVFRRCVAIFTTRESEDPERAACEQVERLTWNDFDAALEAHASRWKDVWARADVEITGCPATEQALRFNAYQLISAADHDPRVSVGARALTGRAYEGHVFWDVEMFQLPFYLHTFPDLARCVLLYRHHTLPGARRRALELGGRGACFAWESTVTGDDVTPRAIKLKTSGAEIPIFTGLQQLHVTSGVAHAVWQYWQATGDRQFMREAGVELLVETARFWVSRAISGPRHLHLRGVVGPDEYHHAVDDNAYTNWMARANGEHAALAVEWLSAEAPGDWESLAARLAVSREEPSLWREWARELFCPGPNADGVIEQFAGFFELEAYPLSTEERFKVPVSRLFDWERLNRLKLIKQADVLMLLHVMPDLFPREILAANYRYYEPITDHASSLSPGIHAAVAARLGLREDAERYWRESLWLDLSDRMGNNALGIHPACMGATWQALVFGFLGVQFTDAGPQLEPHGGLGWPVQWREVALTLTWRGRTHHLRSAREKPT